MLPPFVSRHKPQSSTVDLKTFSYRAGVISADLATIRCIKCSVLRICTWSTLDLINAQVKMSNCVKYLGTHTCRGTTNPFAVKSLIQIIPINKVKMGRCHILLKNNSIHNSFRWALCLRELFQDFEVCVTSNGFFCEHEEPVSH